jgi:outer membrane protein, heavy metal efflux system
MIKVQLIQASLFVGLVLALIGRGSEVNAQLLLSEAITEAVEKNPEIQLMRQRLQAVSARAKQAPYLEDPEINFQLGGVPLSTPTNFNNADTNSIGIRQKLPFFGKLGLKEKVAQQEVRVAEQELRAKERDAQQEVRVAEQELRAKEREIISMVKMAYADLFMGEKASEILREQLEIMRTLIRATEARYQVGRVTQQDVFKALLEQSEIMNQLINVEAESSTAQAKLNNAMYRAPRSPVQLPANLTPPSVDLNLPSLDDLALANRPQLKGAEEEIVRSERTYELADRNRKFPDFMVGWDYMRMPTDMKKDRYGAMINITVPFSPWTIGRREYEVEESLAEIRAAKANREAMRNMTVREVAESQAKVQAARRSITLYSEGLLTQAELSFRSAMSAYQTGRVEFVTLLEAQRALREARMGYYKATVSFLQNLADLERVVGKDLQ